MTDEPVTDEPPVTSTASPPAVLAGLAASSSLARPLRAQTSESPPAVRAPASISVQVGPEGPAAVRRHVTNVLASYDVGDEMSADVQLLVSELVSNVIRHEDAATIRVDVLVAANLAVTVTVAGGGPASPSDALVHPPGMSRPPSESGRGLGVLDALSTAWGTRRQHNRTAVWFIVGEPDQAVRDGAGYAAADDAADVGEMSLSLPDVEGVAPTVRMVGDVGAGADVVGVEVAGADVVGAGVLGAGDPVLITERAAETAAATAAAAARRSRIARAAAATAAAEAVAQAAARTVETVQRAADDLAGTVARAADEAARTVMRSMAGGESAESALEAIRVGAAVISAAATTAEETARAAVLVARAVAASAAAVAATTTAEAAAVEDEVVSAASALQAVTTATAHQLAIDTLDRAAAVQAAARRASITSARVHEADLELQRAVGRHDRRVAVALQQAMLTQLPVCDGLELAARYLTAAAQDQVGGDWYDALVLPNGCTVLVIGDVIGHDIAAAALMGQLRNLLRALVWDRDEPPSQLVSRLDRAIRDLRLDTMATLILMMVDPPAAGAVGRTIRWTNAGHPAPVLVQLDGTAETLDATSDLILGVDASRHRRDCSVLVAPGATLLLYTDGLIETALQDVDEGQSLLLDVVRSHHLDEPAALLDAVLAAMVGDRPADDVAVMAVRLAAP